MIKLFLKKLLIICFAISVFIPVVVYAIDNSTQNNLTNKEFFYVDNNEVAPGEEVTMYIDLLQIGYNDFEFTLNSNIELQEILTNEQINTNIENNEFTIISNKSEINMDKILLCYKIPVEMEIGRKIKLVGKIKENIELEENNNVQNIEQDESINKEQSEKKVTIIINIVEKKDKNEEENSNTNNEEINDNNKNNENIEDNKNDMFDENNKTSINQMQNSKTQLNTTQNYVISQKQINTQTKQITVNANSNTNNNINSQETLTYNGESNNYLSSLSVDGYELKSGFSKVNNTYFLNIEKDVTSININAETEDKNAKLKIYGNKNLQEGENKVLISVTAENGEVKTYRIYVTK